MCCYAYFIYNLVVEYWKNSAQVIRKDVASSWTRDCQKYEIFC